MPVDLPPVDEIWLEDWQIAPRIPVVNSTNNAERQIIRAMRLGEPVSFLYYAGSNPGKMSRVRPSMLYRVEGFTGIYLTGYCEDRQDTRTFRMDRAQMQPNHEA
jgi:predicted DNA-binding transcriptional regulator YafY